MNPLEATPYELKILQAWAGQDKTRPYLCRVYTYRSDGGVTSVATNGHIILVRRSGEHIKMSYNDIEKLGHDQQETPPPWSNVIVQNGSSDDPKYDNRSISPRYFGMLADLESAAGKRAAEDYTPRYGTAKKTIAQDKQNRKNHPNTCLSIPSDPYAGWTFRLDMITYSNVQWTGVIMPRRP